MTALLPRWLNIRRGSYICAIVGLVMCPWNLLSSSNNFTTYLSAYSVFLSSIAGVMICDYYFVRKGFLQTRDLYSALRSGPYYYTLGVHWRAYAAYIAGILINIVGFAGAVGNEVPTAATKIVSATFSSHTPCRALSLIHNPVQPQLLLRLWCRSSSLLRPLLGLARQSHQRHLARSRRGRY